MCFDMEGWCVCMYLQESLRLYSTVPQNTKVTTRPVVSRGLSKTFSKTVAP
jgi:hypothetical protein